MRSIGQKILLVVGLAASIGMTASLWAYSVAQEKAMRTQNERLMAQTSESVIKALLTVMLDNDAEIAQAISDQLKTVTGAQDFRILRIDGTEAFRDSRTIRAVNSFLEEDAFADRKEGRAEAIVAGDSPDLARAIAGGKPISLYADGADGQPSMTVLAPILNVKGCPKCHGDQAGTLGFIKFSVTLAPLEQEIAVAKQRGLAMIGASLLLTLVFTAIIMRRVVSRPIAVVIDAMRKAAGGDLNSKAIATGDDEIAQMASSFNTMTTELRRAHEDMQREHDKLRSIIRFTAVVHSAKEAIVVADASDRITLVTPSAEILLGKTVEAISAGAFVDVLDDPVLMKRLLDDPEGKPEIIRRGDLVLSAQASRVQADGEHKAGSAALIRDVTAEKTLEEELRRLSTTDGLSGLFNRRFLDDTLDKEFARAQRYGRPLSILMLDIDHFKKFNDLHGHEMGDRVLKAVAATMRSCLRTQDFPCRYGGEEFVAILPDTASDSAAEAAERLRLAISTISVDGLSVTVSIGYASFPELTVKTSAELVEKADGALYLAKSHGRNRCLPASTST